MPHSPSLRHNRRELDQLAKSVGIRIPKKQGESAIQLLARMKLLDRKLAPRIGDDTINLPLTREPTSTEKEELERVLGKQNLTREKFRPRSQPTGSLEEVLSRQIPQEVVPLVSKSFDIIGDIAIVELSPGAETYEREIAEALMRVHKSVRTVYSKAGPITDSLRLRPLHLVLGENRSETIHREHGSRFKVDVSKAFFSPRLSSEHKRVADQVEPGECVVDMFAGVGPFSILIAKRIDRVKVHAIDANPEAANLIEENMKLNRVQEKITVWSGDARTVVRNHLLGTADRVIMNHPSEAKNFLEDACKAIKQSGGILHYYTFTDGEDCEQKATDELTSSLPKSRWKTDGTPAAHRVRGVAPLKWQVAVDARLVRA